MTFKLSGRTLSLLCRSSWVFFAKISSAICGFGIFWIIARHYSIQQVGEYVFLQSVSALVVMTSNWGVNELVFRECSLYPEQSGSYLKISRKAKAILGIMLGVASGLILFGLSHYSVNIFLALLITAMTDAQTISYFMILRANDDNLTEGIVLPTRAIIKLLFCSSLFLVDFNLLELLLVMLIANLLALLIVGRRTNYKIRSIIAEFPEANNTVVNILKRSTPYALSGIVGSMSAQARVALVGVLGGSALVAQYSVGMQFYQVINFIPSALNITIQPRMARLYSNDQMLWRHEVKVLLGGVALLGILIGAGCVFILPLIVAKFFGERYASALELFPFLGIACSLNVMWVSILSAAIIGAGKVLKFVRMSIIELVVSLSLACLLIPQFGLVGSGIMFITSDLIIFLLLMRWFWGESRDIRSCNYEKH
ncbi:lipopolysaccharide biosynthesis protein [Geobacter sp. OR-1]|uniref:lipopolysaccharide biosynthesis protein n=1 Tax=Geobacter sp. OR-1 TaxID=1266765 RepID=UPI0005A771C8|nr:hypothetical protein [Geobacter sp. OR-1]